MGFQKVTWNFLEAGHGKGPADGVGAAIKRQADAIVAQGIDIPNGKVLYEKLRDQPSSVQLMYVTEEEIERMDSVLPEDLITIKGTMQIHQIVSTRPGDISWRVLSCFCSEPQICQCFGLQHVEQPGAQRAQRPESALGPPIPTLKSQDITLLHEGLIGSWCVVRYDGNPYTGLIQDVNSENGALVKTMSRIGKNRWYWPMNDDIIWYQPEDVLRLVPEPQPVTKRHMMLDPLVWEEVLTEFDCE
ncbi:hypothetical protein ABG768_018944 [Culter alburnus]|uniref:Uncharacterized protein n=1 Tax=Culter alburnus TaxID=194366 RepID=A0AAW2AVR8_CULAL